MRRISLALVLAATAAALPAAAQEEIRTASYAFDLPAGFGPATATRIPGAPVTDVREAVREPGGWLMLAMTSTLPQPATMDTLGRYAALTESQRGFASGAGMTETGAATRFSTPEILGMRVAVKGGSIVDRGWLVVAVPRTGAAGVVMLVLGGRAEEMPADVADAIIASLRPGFGAEGETPPPDVVP
jgi:hypothetical protein